MKSKLEWIARNLMTVATIVLSMSSLLAGIVGVLPADQAAQVTTWSFVAGAVGRALVHTAQELRKPPTADDDPGVPTGE